ncbi:MAG: amino acid ABC transporter permease [Actinobacteria bacterium]|nr:amino acid ABC transporter permease [Actinomycetota bacterium]
MSDVVLYDVQGPKARRRVLLYSVGAVVVLLLLIALAARRLAENGQFEADLYRPFVDEPQLYERLGVGLRNTLKAAGYGLVLAVLLGVVLAFGRLSRLWLFRLPAVGVIEFFRATPLLLLILFFFLAFPLAFGTRLEPLTALVLGLTLYNGAVIAEIIRAGILSLPGGQSEAAMAIGLRRGQTLRLVLLPQAVRIMLPSLVSQLVVLLKDTSLGFIIGFEELLRIGGQVVQVLDNPIQLYVVIALIYIAINLSLGRLASWIESRQRRTLGTALPAEQPEGGLGKV